MTEIEEVKTIVSKCQVNGLATHNFRIKAIASVLTALEEAHNALEMLPPKDVEIHERTQFKIEKTVDRLLIESLQKEIKRLQWAASNAFDNLNQLKLDDVEEAKQLLYKALTESK